MHFYVMFHRQKETLFLLIVTENQELKVKAESLHNLIPVLGSNMPKVTLRPRATLCPRAVRTLSSPKRSGIT